MTIALSLDDTIAAISTATGRAGIGVIKVSGPHAIAGTLRFFKKKNGTTPAPSEIISHKMIHGWISTQDNDQILDEVLWVCMKKPHSYTGEDVSEIHTHGSHVVLQTILEQLLSESLIRLATPGEFTRRAFLNGRMDLTHAEAIHDVIHAQTPKSLSLMSSHLSGLFRQTIDNLQQSLIQYLSNAEALIDFPDDMLDTETNDNLPEILESQINQINQYIADSHQTAIYREGARVVIVGRPNVGKSSLMNCLLAQDRAIVSTEPGTTRDIIDAQINIDDIPVTLFDTAGIHDTNNAIEQQGITRAKSLIGDADLILFLMEADQKLSADDLLIHEQITDFPWILCANKVDRLKKKSDMAGMPKGWPSPIAISARYDQGIDLLKQAIVNHLTKPHTEMTAPEFMINLRQRKCLEKARDCLKQAQQACSENMPLDCALIDIRLALDALAEITGGVHHEHILDEIFSTFCIGK